MNLPTITETRLTAFVFGAVFNMLALAGTDTILLYTVKSLVGGFIWMCFQILSNHVDRKLRGYQDEKNLSSEKKYDEKNITKTSENESQQKKSE